MKKKMPKLMKERPADLLKLCIIELNRGSFCILFLGLDSIEDASFHFSNWIWGKYLCIESFGAQKKNQTFQTKAQKSGALNLPYLNRKWQKETNISIMWCSLKRTKLTIHHGKINKNRYIWTRTAFEWFPCIALNKFRSLHWTKKQHLWKITFRLNV